MKARNTRTLPDELITYIILRLPFVDILRCMTLSKHVKSIIESSSVIQYKTELAANGLVPCPGSTMSTAASLRRLKEQQEAWRTCTWKEEHNIELRAGCRTYELRNGIWAFGHNDLTPDGTFPADYTTTITCCTLPSATSSKGNDAYGAHWSLKDLGLAIRDFTMDPLVDMLVLVEQTPNGASCPFRIHIRRLSDGQPHEMAAKAVLDFEMRSSNRSSCSFAVQLHGPYVGALVRQDVGSGDYDYLGVWNFQTGLLQMYMGAETCSFDDFAFIDIRTIILAVLGHPAALQVWYFDDSQVLFAGSFCLPITTFQNAYLEMHFDGSPSPSPAGAKTLDGTPFTPSPESQVIAVSFGVIESDPELEAAEVAGFTMIMRPSLMLDVLKRLPPSDYVHTSGDPSREMQNNEKTLEWDAWGPECTRWISLDPDHLNWEPCSFGGRYAVVGHRDPEPVDAVYAASTQPQVIRVYDFRPEIVSRYRDKGSFPGSTTCMEGSVVPKDTMFVDDIVSRLPYHVVTSQDLDCRVSGVMIDEGRLVCTKEEVDEEWRSLKVLTF